MEFVSFGKIPRLTRECFITEKIDGTNASVYIGEDGTMLFGSRTRWITPEDDNFGFAHWATAHHDELRELGPGHHFGEWWGRGIQRSYGQDRKRFSLFNVKRWSDNRPACCDVVPTLYQGEFSTLVAGKVLCDLRYGGSLAAPGWSRPEGIIIYHVQGGVSFKKTIDKDEEPKSKAA